jgi:tRNA U34 2-thiouridine synthase MnmA/TrmU
MHQQQEQLQKLAVPVNVITPAEVTTALSVKEAFLAKLKNKSQHINFNKEKLAGTFIDRSNQIEKED